MSEVTAIFPVKEQADGFVESQTTLNNLPQPRLESLTELLVQGTISKDNDLLEKALSITDMELIKSALEKIPEDHILSLLEEIVLRIERRPMRTLLLIPWLRTLLQVRTTYFLTVPSLDTKLRPLQSIIEARTKTYCRMVQLRGRLDMMLQQVEENKRDHPLVNSIQLQKSMATPMVMYDESSGEDESVKLDTDDGDDDEYSDEYHQEDDDEGDDDDDDDEMDTDEKDNKDEMR